MYSLGHFSCLVTDDFTLLANSNRIKSEPTGRKSGEDFNVTERAVPAVSVKKKKAPPGCFYLN